MRSVTTEAGDEIAEGDIVKIGKGRKTWQVDMLLQLNSGAWWAALSCTTGYAQTSCAIERLTIVPPVAP